LVAFSPLSQVPLPHFADVEQSAGQLVAFSPFSQAPLPHLFSGQTPQSAEQLLQLSPDSHVPLPQTGPHAHTPKSTVQSSLHLGCPPHPIIAHDAVPISFLSHCSPGSSTPFPHTAGAGNEHLLSYTQLDVLMTHAFEHANWPDQQAPIRFWHVAAPKLFWSHCSPVSILPLPQFVEQSAGQVMLVSPEPQTPSPQFSLHGLSHSQSVVHADSIQPAMMHTEIASFCIKTSKVVTESSNKRP
jgi:hypothetical protein